MTDYQEAVSRHANRCCPVCAVVHEADKDERYLGLYICRACGAVYVPRPLEADER